MDATLTCEESIGKHWGYVCNYQIFLELSTSQKPNRSTKGKKNDMVCGYCKRLGHLKKMGIRI